MGLIIKRKIEEEYFLFVTGVLKPGDYIRIRKNEIGKDGNGYFARDFIEAPPGITILRDSIVAEEGGLESVIEQIKCGNFDFKTKRFMSKIDR